MATEGPGARVEVFLDHSNFYHGLKQQFIESGGRYDFTGLVREVVRGRHLVHWNHYCGQVLAEHQPEPAAAQQRFHSYLSNRAAESRIPLKLNLRPLMYPPGFPRSRAPVEKGIDALIVQDLIVGAFDKRYDVAVLLSGDRDFCNVVEFLKVRFPALRLETLFANTRRHLYDMKPHCFDSWRVIDRHVYQRISVKSR